MLYIQNNPQSPIFLILYVGILRQFMQTPHDAHMDCAKRMLRYVNGTLDYGIFYKCGAPLRLEGFTDANWAGNASDKQSTSGFMFSLGLLEQQETTNIRSIEL